MYATGYKRLFWGMVFIIFDIYLGYINILPDFIGYIFIYSALNILEIQQSMYKKAKIATILLIILTIKNLWQDPGNNIFSGGFYNLGTGTLLLGTVVTILKLYIFYILCLGIYELSKGRELDSLKESTEGCWKFYFWVSLASLSCTPFFLNLNIDLKLGIIIIVGIFQVIAGIRLALLFRKCKIEL